jgi:hypothetical protein
LTLIALVLSIIVTVRTIGAQKSRRLSNASSISTLSKIGSFFPLLSLIVSLVASVLAIASFGLAWDAFGKGEKALIANASDYAASIGSCTWMLLAAFLLSLAAVGAEVLRYWATSPMRVESIQKKRTPSWSSGMGKWVKMVDDDAVPVEEGHFELEKTKN